MTRLAKGGCLTTSLNSEMLPDKRTSVHSLTLPMCLSKSVRSRTHRGGSQLGFRVWKFKSFAQYLMAFA